MCPRLNVKRASIAKASVQTSVASKASGNASCTANVYIPSRMQRKCQVPTNITKESASFKSAYKRKQHFASKRNIVGNRTPFVVPPTCDFAPLNEQASSLQKSTQRCFFFRSCHLLWKVTPPPSPPSEDDSYVNTFYGK